MKKPKFIIFILILCFAVICYCNELDKRWKIAIGSNYTKFRTINSEPEFGYSFGIFRQGIEQARTNIQFGFTIHKRNISMSDKIIQFHSNQYNDIRKPTLKSDLYSSILNLEFNLILKYNLFSISNFKFYPNVGIGYSMYNRVNTIDSNTIEVDDTKNHDFIYGDFSGLFSFINSSGWVNYIGLSIIKNKYALDIYYSKYNNIFHHSGFSIPNNNMILDEKIHSLNLMLGICF